MASDRVIEMLAQLPQADAERFLHDLSPAQMAEMPYDWSGLWARPNQLEPEGSGWLTWLVLAGRGWGKTRTGAEWIRQHVSDGTAKRIAFVAATAADCRDTLVEGKAGILEIFPPNERPSYEPSKRRVTFRNGAVATLFSSEEPDRLRGPEHDIAWLDELASWRFVQESWDNLKLGLRKGSSRVAITTTPRPLALLKTLLADAQREGSTVVVTKGSTYENINNLSASFRDEVLQRYEGTRLGRQELYADILEDAENALWKRDTFDRTRVDKAPTELVRIVVGVDPSGGVTETGIIVAGRSQDDNYYVLDDATTGGSPNLWGQAVISSYNRFQADRIIGESNNGGAMVESVIRSVDRRASYKPVFASRGKRTRAEPVAAMYEQGKVHHVGMLSALENELCTWTPDVDESPNRLDALVWALAELSSGAGTPVAVAPIAIPHASIWMTRSKELW
jgi:phage terminase large subunit-like protein